jgi:hypothetical protein
VRECQDGKRFSVDLRVPWKAQVQLRQPVPHVDLRCSRMCKRVEPASGKVASINCQMHEPSRHQHNLSSKAQEQRKHVGRRLPNERNITRVPPPTTDFFFNRLPSGLRNQRKSAHSAVQQKLPRSSPRRRLNLKPVRSVQCSGSQMID